MKESKRTHTNKKSSNKTARPAHMRRSSAVSGSSRSTARRKRVLRRNLGIGITCGILLCLLVFMGKTVLQRANERDERELQELVQEENGPLLWQKQGAPYIDVQLLTPNEYSRPQIPMESVQYIAIHYTANPGAGAMANRNYFENLSTTRETKLSSHFVVGLEGEVVQCIPTAEISYATNERNVDTISIENCHPDETGAFNDATYDSTVKLAAWLCTRFGLTQDQVIRHYDVTGKNCPKYYVEHPEAWEQMKEDIRIQIQEDYALQEKLQNSSG